MIKNVLEYKFIGTPIKSNSKLTSNIENIARKVMYLIKANVASLWNLPIEMFSNLFAKEVQTTRRY